MKAKLLSKYSEGLKSDIPLPQVIEYLSNEDDEISMKFTGKSSISFNNRITDMNIIPIVNSYLLCVVKIQIVDLSYNKLTDMGVSILCKTIELAENIKILNLKSNQISDNGCEKLTKALKGKIYLADLNLNTNIINNLGILHLTELLYTNTALLSLDIGSNRYDWEALIAVAAALNKYNTSLMVLNIDDPWYKNPDQDFFTHFGKMFVTNPVLKKVSMRFHKLRFEGMNIITHYLKLNQNLEVLDISCNQICFQGVKYIGDYLAHTKTLLSINLSSNHIHDAGAKILAAGIYNNKSVIYIDITNNTINDEGLSRLAEAFKENTEVLSLKLFRDNNFGKESISLFKTVLESKIEFYPDFTIYSDVTGELNIAYLETYMPKEENYII